MAISFAISFEAISIYARSSMFVPSSLHIYFMLINGHLLPFSHMVSVCKHVETHFSERSFTSSILSNNVIYGDKALHIEWFGPTHTHTYTHPRTLHSNSNRWLSINVTCPTFEDSTQPNRAEKSIGTRVVRDNWKQKCIYAWTILGCFLVHLPPKRETFARGYSIFCFVYRFLPTVSTKVDGNLAIHWQSLSFNPYGILDNRLFPTPHGFVIQFQPCALQRFFRKWSFIQTKA